MKILQLTRLPKANYTQQQLKSKWFKHFFASYAVVFFGYMAMYLIRKNFNISQNHLIEQYGLSKTVLGSIAFCFSITYGVGKLVLGYYGDGRNTKNFVAVLLIIAATMNIMLGLSLGSGIFNIILMGIFFGLNGFFQSAGGPASLSTITKWTARKNRGTFFGIWNISHNAGGALAAVVALFGANTFFNGSAVGLFIFPAIIAIIIGVIGLFVGNDSPEAYGLGKAEEIFNEPVNYMDNEVNQANDSKFNVFLKYVVKNPFVWAVAIANIFVYIVRIGVDQWSVVYGYQVLNFSKEEAVVGFTMFELGALFSLVFGAISDLLKGRRALVSMVCMVAVLFILQYYQHASSFLMYKVALFALGFLIFGPQLLLGVSVVGFVPKNATAAADGFKGMTAYLLGDSFAKIGLALIADGHSLFGLTGWSGTFTAIYAALIIGIGLLVFVVYGEEKMIRRTKI